MSTTYTLLTTTNSMLPTHRAPTSPGEILREEFLVPLKMTVNELAAASKVDRVTLSRILNGHRQITAETSVKLGRLLGVNEGFFLDLQNAVDVWRASRRVRGIAPLPMKRPRPTRGRTFRRGAPGENSSSGLRSTAARRRR